MVFICCDAMHVMVFCRAGVSDSEEIDVCVCPNSVFFVMVIANCFGLMIIVIFFGGRVVIGDDLSISGSGFGRVCGVVAISGFGIARVCDVLGSVIHVAAFLVVFIGYSLIHLVRHHFLCVVCAGGCVLISGGCVRIGGFVCNDGCVTIGIFCSCISGDYFVSVAYCLFENARFG